ncbi:MAG TPA: hypothetical protein VK646_00890 [Actinomycetota bacterium]|nr:hypothetical protein [Actinomycetota bacterium]
MKARWVALVLGIAMSVPVPAAAAPRQVGVIDPTFGRGGEVTVGFVDARGTPLVPQVAGVAVQPDGKIVVAGSAGTRFRVVRFDPDGTLDPTFGTGGIAAIWFSSGTTAYGAPHAEAMLLQPDGKIVVVGGARDDSVFAVARFDADGSPDTTFGGTGKVATAVSDVESAAAYAVALQPDGKLIVAGTAFIDDQVSALVRYDTDGTLDPTFGTGGIVTDASSPQADAVVVQPDGKIVSGGTIEQSKPNGGARFRFSLARFSTGGSIDPSFGTDGWVRTGFGPRPYDPNYQFLNALAVQPDGRVIAAGTAHGPYDAVIAMARYRNDGSLDPTFGDGGKVQTADPNWNLEADAIALAPDGGIAVAGTATWGTPAYRTTWVTARYTADGLPDLSFSGDGRVLTPLDGRVKQMGAAGVAVQPDGDVVVAGTVPAHDGRIAVIRYAPPAFRPDLRFGPVYATLAGDDLYSADPSAQSFPLITSHRAPGIRITVENDGTSPDRFILGGCRNSSRFVVQYLNRGQAITGAMKHGVYRTPLLPPGGRWVVLVHFTARPGTTLGASMSCVVRATSVGTPTRIDTVRVTLLLTEDGCRPARQQLTAACE